MSANPELTNPFYGWYDVMELSILCDDDIWRPLSGFRPDHPVWYFSPEGRWTDIQGNTNYTGNLYNYQESGKNEVQYCYDAGAGLLLIDILPETDHSLDFIESFLYTVESSGGSVILTGVTDKWPIEICYKWHLQRNGAVTVKK